MGSGYNLTCKKCGYSFGVREGSGFLFPVVYEETVQDAKDGKLGKEIQGFFEEHPDGAINAEYVALCCDKCGDLFSGMDLTMYISKKKKPSVPKHGKWSVAFPYEGRDYVTKNDLEMRYSEYSKYPHRCEKCGGSAHIVDPDETLLCPRCKIPMDNSGVIHWD